MHIYRSKFESNRKNPSWEERWRQADQGLIMCWERGREMANDPKLAQLAERASAGKLVPLSWKGGLKPSLDPKRKTKKKLSKNYGTLFYLATWQGLRGDDLDIYTDKDVLLVCTQNKIEVTFTDDKEKLKAILK